MLWLLWLLVLLLLPFLLLLPIVVKGCAEFRGKQLESSPQAYVRTSVCMYVCMYVD